MIKKILGILALLLVCHSGHAQVSYQDVCIEQKSNVPIQCLEAPRHFTDWTYSTGYSGAADRTDKEAVIQATIDYFYSPSYCSRGSYSLGAEEVLGRDPFLNSKRPVWTKQVLKFYFIGKNSEGECTERRDFGVYLYSGRSASCFDPEVSMDSPERLWKAQWFSDVKGDACIKATEQPIAPICSRDLGPETDLPLIGNPIQIGTGNKIMVEPDFVDHRAAPLSIYRIYNSGWLYKENEINRHPPITFGFGWTHNHAAWLTSFRQYWVFNIYTDVGPQALEPLYERFNVYTGMGDSATFYRKLTDEQYRPLDEDALGNPEIGVFIGGNPGQKFERVLAGWKFTNEVGDVYLFNDQGEVIAKDQTNGDQYRYAYSGLNTTITNQYGRSVVLHGNVIQYSTLQNKSQVIVSTEPDEPEPQALHVITRVEPSHGRSTTYSYPNQEPLLGSIVFADHSSQSYLYNADDYLIGKKDELGVRIGTYEYQDGKAVKSSKANGVETYLFSHTGTSSTVTTPLNERLHFGTTRTGERMVLAGNGRTKISSLEDDPIKYRKYSQTLLPERYADYKGTQIDMTWDAQRRLPQSITKAANYATTKQTTRITWHPTLRKPTRIVEEEGARTSDMTYNSRGDLLSLTVSDTSPSTSGPSATSHHYEWTYNTQGEVLTETDAKGGVTTHTYDARSNRTSTTNPLGQVTQYTQYDAHDRLLEAIDPAGRHYQFTYDGRDRITSVTAAGLQTQLTWQANGTLTKVQYPNGYVLNYQYDSAQRMVGWSDNRGQQGNYTLDPVGNRLEETVTNAQNDVAWEVHRTITDNNRLTSLSQAGQTAQYAYDSNGDLTSVSNGLNEASSVTLDALRRPTQVRDPQNNLFTLAYNPLDALVQATDAKNVSTRFTRDYQGNATMEASPDIGTATSQYDAAGLPTRITDALGQATAIAYDALGRPTRINYADGTHTAITYDLTGAPSQIVDPAVTTTFTRDAAGRITTQVQTLTGPYANTGPQRVTSYSYMPAGYGGAGQLASITYPSGKTLQYDYDTTGQLTGLQWQGSALLSSLGWNPMGQPTGWEWDFIPNASTTHQASRSYNTAGQLTATENLALTWNAAGRVSQIEQQVLLPQANGSIHTAQSLPVTTLFSYDKAGRLTGYEHTGAGTTASLPTGMTAYKVLGYHKATYYYDANGNRTSAGYTYPKTTGTGNNTLDRRFSLNSSNGNRIQGVSQNQTIEGQRTQNPERTLSWDPAGNLLSNGITSHSHNAQAQVASSTREGQTTQYLYNSASQRVRKSGAATIDYSYGLPELQMDNWPMGIYQQGPQAQTTEIIYLPTSAGPLPVAADINGELFAIHTDHLNTPRRLTSSQGQAVWQWVISGFGEMPATTAANAFVPEGEGSFTAINDLPEVTFPLRYPGQVEDPETGLFYNHHRYYDPYLTVGYTQADPVGLFGGWNRFTYVGANPLADTDSSGLCYGPFLSACVRVIARSPWVQSAMTAATTMAWSFINGEAAVATAVPATVSRLTPVARAIHEGFDTGAFCAAKDLAPIWSATRNKSAVENAYGHWQKHAAEFPELINSKQYVDTARSLVAHPPTDALTKARGAEMLIYDPATNTFLVRNANGVPKTMFRPADGINYWNRQ